MVRIRFGVALAALLLALVWASLSPPGASAQPAPGEGPGGPILVVTDGSATFGRFYAEILRTEGLNEFAVSSTAALNPSTLAAYQVVVLASTAMNDGQVAALNGWVQGGGNLIAMRPDARLAGLLGLGSDSGDLSEGYMKIDTGSAPGAGITGDTMQFHGTADRWSPAGATTVATLYSDATNATSSPAVTLRSIGGAGGQAAAFTYDLAQSVVETRQGNPVWAGQERDGQPDVIRSDDLFFPNWVNLDKVRIPQADEQQRLLANLITQMNLDRAPLPRFWYLPRGEKAAVVMTGDDHGVGGTSGQFDGFKAASPPGCSVADWQCIRSTSYVYSNTSIPNAAGYQADGFEIALHLSTGCGNFTLASLRGDWASQLPAFSAAFPNIAAPRTNRTHCIAWSDWASEPIAEGERGVRFDTNYYYWPGAWVQNRPGMFTGSGMPMRFADLDGSVIDVYQAATQMTDESDITIPVHASALLDGALGADGYYGVFTANMHTDTADHPGANAIVAEAKARGVPVVSAAQMLDWVDGRNGSAFQGVSYGAGQLRFSLARAATARGLQAMLPANSATGGILSLTRDGVPVSATPRAVKGIGYVVFDAAPGNYVATYTAPPMTTPPAASAVLGANARGGSATGSLAPVKVVTRTVRVSRKGVVRLRVKCQRAESRCRVDIRLRSGGRDLARKKLSIAGGRTVSVRLQLTRKARALLAANGSLRVKAVIRVTGAARGHVTTTTRIRLLAPGRR